MDADRVAELLALERQGWDSLCDGTGAKFYGNLMTGDGIMVLANGQALTRNDVVESLQHAPPWQSYDIADARIVALASGDAALVYRGTARREGDGTEFVGMMTSVYTRVDDDWRLAVYQQTPVP